MGLDTYFFRRLRKLPATAEQASIIRTTIANADPFNPAQKQMLLGTIKDGLDLLKKTKQEVSETDRALIDSFEPTLDKFVEDGINPKTNDYDPVVSERVRGVYRPLGTLRHYLDELYRLKAHEKEVAYFRKNWDVVEFFDHAKNEDNCKEFELSKDDIRSLRDHCEERLRRRDWGDDWEKRVIQDVIKQMNSILSTTNFETSMVYMWNWW